MSKAVFWEINVESVVKPERRNESQGAFSIVQMRGAARRRETS